MTADAPARPARGAWAPEGPQPSASATRRASSSSSSRARACRRSEALLTARNLRPTSPRAAKQVGRRRDELRALLGARDAGASSSTARCCRTARTTAGSAAADALRGHVEELTAAVAPTGHFIPEEDPAWLLAQLDAFLATVDTA